MQARSEGVTLPHATHFKMDKEQISIILDKFGAGILGEENDGTLRVAFSRNCEMVDELVHELQTLGFDIYFSDSISTNKTLVMNITPLTDVTESVSHELLSNFVWLPNKMGMYSFNKIAMQGVILRQLFLQLETNFVASMLEDEPGTDNFHLHVIRKENAKKTEEKILKQQPEPNFIEHSLLFISGVLLIAILAFYTKKDWIPLLQQWA